VPKDSAPTYVDWFDDAAIGLRALVTHSYKLRDGARSVADLRQGQDHRTRHLRHR
jgi:hypothetical protein